MVVFKIDLATTDSGLLNSALAEIVTPTKIPAINSKVANTTKIVFLPFGSLLANDFSWSKDALVVVIGSVPWVMGWL